MRMWYRDINVETCSQSVVYLATLGPVCQHSGCGCGGTVETSWWSTIRLLCETQSKDHSTDLCKLICVKMSQHFLQLTVSQQTLGQHSTGWLPSHQTAALWGVMQLCAHRSGTVHLHEADSPPSHHPHHAGIAQDTFTKPTHHRHTIHITRVLHSTPSWSRLTFFTPSTSRGQERDFTLFIMFNAE